MKRRDIALEVIVFLYIAMLMYAGVTKLIHYDKTYQQMWNQPFDTMFAPFLTWFIPSLEIVLCILMAVGRTRKWGLYGATALMAVFTVYVGIIWFGRENFKVPCSCGGFMAAMDWPEHFWFNLGYVALGIIGIFLQKNPTLPKQKQLAT
ncbi:MauE/DoxX family redox-associated membrane protein [Chitinophaga sp. 212800010-3]|uniref:MauE/DoxX family redox-associated membrane protein n=1 Tax=unclassified Chitinophaga TaxID=2619133 RepID=UPI002DEFD04F|nr:DoxX family membrane protein [Chitinophaga sp. 212800010-3]